MMVSCPGCNMSYSLDDQQAADGNFTCLECSKEFRIQRPVRTPESGGPPAGKPPAGSGSRFPPQTDPGVLGLQESSGNLTRPVACPSCGHLFVPPAGRKPPRGARSRILVVEDQKYFAELTRDALGPAYETTVAPTLSAAREAISETRFDLVILDLSLEGDEDGAQMLQAISRRNIPTLIFTARDETELYEGVWERLKSAGATDILIKGMNVGEDLRQKVKSLLRAPADTR